ncbi:MAG: HEAT repeat domain-containing protein [Verrucomicrobia bacterium]|nr:HEAT repeat domain-containing protein [Verrucomicrobiota bacterium]
MKLIRLHHLVLTLTFALAATQLPAVAQSGGDDVYQALVKREFGTAVEALTAIEKQVQSAKPEEYPVIEARLIAVIENPEATMPGKQFACQMLRLVGAHKCVATMAKLLTDDNLSHMARNVLLGMNDPAAADALRQALGTTQGKIRIGIINTIGDRRDRDSLDALAALLTNGDEAVIDSALAAIGKIGGPAAADALDGAKVPDSVKPIWAQSYLRCAGGLAAQGNTERAQKMYQALLEGHYSGQVSAGAFRAIVMAQKESAVPLIVQTLGSADKLMKRAALTAVVEVPGHAVTAAFAQQLADLAPEAKVTLLRAVAARGDSEGLTELVNKLATDENAMIREAAIAALGRVGDASSVPVLLAALKDGTNGARARQSLIELRGNGVAASLIQQFENGPDTQRPDVLSVLAERREAATLPVARKMLNNEDPRLQQAAVKVLGEQGTEEDLPRLCESILTVKEDGERDRLKGAIIAVGSRMADHAKREEVVLQAFAKADAPTQIQLLAVLSAFGGNEAFAAARGALVGPGEVRKAAVRALAEWPDSAPLADLRAVAKGENDAALKILALRVCIKMINPSSLNPEEKVQAFREAMELATRIDEKRQVLNEIGRLGEAGSLKIVEPCLGDNQLKREACQAYERIAEALAGREPALAKEALEKVLATTADKGLQDKAKAALEKIK